MSKLDELISGMLKNAKDGPHLKNMDLVVLEILIEIKYEIELLKEEVRKLNE